MSKLEFYGEFIEKILRNTLDSAHDRELSGMLNQTMLDMQRVVNETSPQARLVALKSTVTFYNEQAESAAGFPPDNDARKRSEAFIDYLRERPEASRMINPRGGTLSNVAGTDGVPPMGAVEYAVHREQMNEAVRDFMNDFLGEMNRSPKAALLLRRYAASEDDVGRDQALSQLQGMAVDSLHDRIEKDRTLARDDAPGLSAS